jgi:protein O-mannosyl-transferase
MPCLIGHSRMRPPLLMQDKAGRAAAILAACVLAAYANALGGPFQFDDYNVIVHNSAVHSLSAWWNSMPGIRPLLKLSYAANWMTGADAAGFRALNVVLHGLNALLVFAVVRRLLGRMNFGEDSASLAFWVTALFALHPAQTEAVTYISGRSVCLMATFELAALLAYLKSDEGPRPIVWRGVSVMLMILALAVKENAWSLPFALLLCEALRPGWRWRAALARTAGHWGVLVVMAGAVVIVPGYWRLLEGSIQTRTLWENLLTQIHGLSYLIVAPLLSLSLNIDPDLPASTSWTPSLVAEAALLVGAIAVAFWQWRRRPWLAFGLLWFFAMLAPTNSIFPRLDVANDRQLYLAMMGPALILVAACDRLLPRRSTVPAFVVLCATLGLATVLRNADYSSEVALWRDAAAKSPDKARVFNNLGYALQQSGRVEDARAAYQRALALDPAHDKARFNLSSLPPAPPAQ